MSATRQLSGFAAKAMEKGKKVYQLNIGQPDIPTPIAFKKEIVENFPEVISYTDSAGMKNLREKFVKYYSKSDIAVTVEDIIITTSGSEALMFAIYSCLDEGDEIITPEPFYTNYATISFVCGVKLHPIPTRIEDNFDLPGVSAFEDAITEKTKAILISNPGNPTGKIYPEESIRELGDVARKHGLFLISDEVYRELCYGQTPHFSVMRLTNMLDNIVLVDSVSKRYSVCGARIGCIVSKNKGVMEASLNLARSRLSSPMLEQIGVMGLLDSGDSYFEEIKAEYKKRKNAVVEVLSQIPNVVIPKVDGALYIIVKLPVDDAVKFSTWLLTDFDIEGETTMLAPALGFYSTPGRGVDEVRIAYVLKEEELRKACRIIVEGVAKYRKSVMKV